MRLHPLRKAITDSKIKVVYNEYSSTDLINWCDVGIVWGSSIGIQLMMYNKSLLYPKYAHKLKTIYDKYLPETVLSNTNSLLNELDKIKSSGSPNYTEDSRDNFIKEIVYNNNTLDSVADRHIKFFHKIEKS